ncbi:MAG: 3-oxoacyl-ACP synthase, partial [Pseudomonadota bacterium]
MNHARIAGTGGYLPEKVVSNDDLAKTIDTSDEWIRERTGIHRRHIAADHETTSSIATEAAKRAIAAAGIDAEAIDLIVVGTTTADKIFPSVACQVQRKLGISGCGAFDVQAACSGFIYGLDIADRFIRTGGARH